MMNDTEKSSAVTLLLLAAFADGNKSDSERSAVRHIAESLKAEAAGINVWRLYADVIGGRASIASAAASLTTHPARLLTYEMAVGVCDSDGPPNAAEQAFLRELRQALHLTETQETAPVDQMAETLALAAVPAAPAVTTPDPAAPLKTPAVDTADTDRLVLNYAILNGALELLPQSLASMAILPLQMKMVYRIGKRHGYTLDRGHIRDFFATAGVGLASQTVEGYARKLLGGFIGRAVGGGMIGGLAKSATRATTGAAFTFATTYALGHVAQRYYAGGRRMDMAVLKDTYAHLLGRGREAFGVHASQVQSRAATLTPTEVMNLVREP